MISFYCINLRNLKKSRKFEKKFSKNQIIQSRSTLRLYEKTGDDKFFNNRAYPTLDIKVNNYIKRPEFTSTDHVHLLLQNHA